MRLADRLRQLYNQVWLCYACAHDHTTAMKREVFYMLESMLAALRQEVSVDNKPRPSGVDSKHIYDLLGVSGGSRKRSRAPELDILSHHCGITVWSLQVVCSFWGGRAASPATRARSYCLRRLCGACA